VVDDAPSAGVSVSRHFCAPAWLGCRFATHLGGDHRHFDDVREEEWTSS
jgi:hypothetical protein